MKSILIENFDRLAAVDQIQGINSTHAGNGIPVILIHGLAASLNDWDTLIPILNQAGFSTNALDLPGHGKGGYYDHSDKFSFDFVFNKFGAWIDSLHLEEPMIFIGHSLGSYIALLYTLRFPDRVKALVLCSPLVCIDQLPCLVRLYYRYFYFDMKIINRLPEKLIRWTVDLTSLSIRNGFVLPQNIRKQTSLDYKRIHPGIFNIIRSLNDLKPALPRISQPTLILWGSHDRTLAPAWFIKIAESFPNASQRAFLGAGHVLHQSHASEVNPLILEFLLNLSDLTSPFANT